MLPGSRDPSALEEKQAEVLAVMLGLPDLALSTGCCPGQMTLGK